MAYTLQEQYSSKNFTPNASVKAVFGQPRKVTGITIHHWGIEGQSFANVRNFLCTNSTPSSAHFIAEAGLVACIVSPLDAAWHSGSAVGNATTIGLELRPEATDGDYRTAAELIAWLRSQFGDVPLIPHRNWMATACPGKWDLARLDRLARGISTPAAKPAPAPAPAPKPVAAPAKVKQTRTIIGDRAMYRTAPSHLAAVHPSFPQGFGRGAQVDVDGFRAGTDPYGTGDDAWYRGAHTGGWFWSNNLSGGLDGLPRV